MKWGIHFDIAGKGMQIELLEGKLEQPGFWDNVAESQAVMKELKNLKDTIEEFEDIKTQYEDVETMIIIAQEENDESLIPEIGEMLEGFKECFERFCFPLSFFSMVVQSLSAT